MRNAFIDTLSDLAAEDERIWLLCGDLGYSVLERFATRYPDRFINAGVAEQNMMGMAAGLAKAGKIVFTYSIANFPVMRCLEQIRNDVGYHSANVKMVSVGGGLAYGAAGYTHYGIEDIAVLRALPNLKIVTPADPQETRAVTACVTAISGPCYLRLGKGGEPALGLKPFELGKAIPVRSGSDVALFACGSILKEALDAAIVLEQAGIRVGVINMPTIKPLDTESIISAARQTQSLIVTIEEHSRVGGLGSAVAETLAESGCVIPLLRLGIDDPITLSYGAQAYMRQIHGLDAPSIAARVRQMLGRK